jgi:hypothetical protein
VLTAEKSTSQRGSWATSSPKGRNPQNLFCGSHWGGPYSGASLLPSFSVQRSYSYRQIWHFFPINILKVRMKENIFYYIIFWERSKQGTTIWKKEPWKISFLLSFFFYLRRREVPGAVERAFVSSCTGHCFPVNKRRWQGRGLGWQREQTFQ